LNDFDKAKALIDAEQPTDIAKYTGIALRTVYNLRDEKTAYEKRAYNVIASLAHMYDDLHRDEQIQERIDLLQRVIPDMPDQAAAKFATGAWEEDHVEYIPAHVAEQFLSDDQGTDQLVMLRGKSRLQYHKRETATLDGQTYNRIGDAPVGTDAIWAQHDDEETLEFVRFIDFHGARGPLATSIADAQERDQQTFYHLRSLANQALVANGEPECQYPWEHIDDVQRRLHDAPTPTEITQLTNAVNILREWTAALIILGNTPTAESEQFQHDWFTDN
jgi:hypothetical protein